MSVGSLGSLLHWVLPQHLPTDLHLLFSVSKADKLQLGKQTHSIASAASSQKYKPTPCSLVDWFLSV